MKELPDTQQNIAAALEQMVAKIREIDQKGADIYVLKTSVQTMADAIKDGVPAEIAHQAATIQQVGPTSYDLQDLMGWLGALEIRVNIDDQQAIGALRMDVDMVKQHVGKVEAAVQNANNQGYDIRIMARRRVTNASSRSDRSTEETPVPTFYGATSFYISWRICGQT